MYLDTWTLENSFNGKARANYQAMFITVLASCYDAIVGNLHTKILFGMLKQQPKPTSSTKACGVGNPLLPKWPSISIEDVHRTGN